MFIHDLVSILDKIYGKDIEYCVVVEYPLSISQEWINFWQYYINNLDIITIYP